MTDFYGTSDAYAITGTMVPNDYTFVAGPTKDAANDDKQNVRRETSTHTLVLVRQALEAWPTEFRMRNTVIRDAVQAKIGTAIPTTCGRF